MTLRRGYGLGVWDGGENWRSMRAEAEGMEGGLRGVLGEKRKPVPGRKPWKMFVLPEAGE